MHFNIRKTERHSGDLEFWRQKIDRHSQLFIIILNMLKLKTRQVDVAKQNDLAQEL